MTDREILADFGNKIVESFRQKQIEQGIYASGKSARGVVAEATDEQLQVIDKEGYVEFELFGRAPGKLPPYESIRAWVELKRRGNIANSIDKETRRVQWKIKLYGTSAYRKYKATGQGTGLLSEFINEQSFQKLGAALLKNKMLEIQTEIKRLLN